MRLSYRPADPEVRYWRAGTSFTTRFLNVASDRPTPTGLRVRDAVYLGSKNTGVRPGA